MYLMCVVYMCCLFDKAEKALQDSLEHSESDGIQRTGSEIAVQDHLQDLFCRKKKKLC